MNGSEVIQDDEFWAIALEDPSHAQSDGVSSTDVYDACEITADEAATRYTLTISQEESITFELAGLAQTDGVLSPVGSQAWHASALLAMQVLRSELLPEAKRGDQITALELGSGAVGLSGLALAVAVGKRFGACQIVLTDLNQDAILENLRRNVETNKKVIENACRGVLPSIRVQELDWAWFQNQEELADLPKLDLVVGSELVYTDETAIACANVISSILNNHPSCLVLIVQIIDRHGFLTEFVPILECKNFAITIEQPIDSQLHHSARDIMMFDNPTKSGFLGVGDRCDYGLCWIRNKQWNG